jgi:hypothetical protein
MDRFRTFKDTKMLHERLAATIKEYGIPRSTIAKLAGLWPTDPAGLIAGKV